MNNQQIPNITEGLTTKTIEDFSDQWKNYQKNPGFYGSKDLLPDLFGPLLPVKNIIGKKVAEIGAGTGRIINMLLDAGVSHAVALEPANEAFLVLQKNTETRKDKLTYLKLSGDKLPQKEELDFVFSIGVIHHIPNPIPVIEASYNALKAGGQIVIWVYGHEGNELYLSLALPIRKISNTLPHIVLVMLTWILVLFLDIYIFLCRFLPLPMHVYMRGVLANFTQSVRRMTIYDQLNPAYAKYYFQNEAEELLTNAGFTEVHSYHRHGYSWTVLGTKK